jgi:hypothetical protein
MKEGRKTGFENCKRGSVKDVGDFLKPSQLPDALARLP